MKKDQTIRIRVTSDEKERLRLQSEEFGCTVSELLLRGLGHIKKVANYRKIASTLCELSVYADTLEDLSIRTEIKRRVGAVWPYLK